MYCTYARGGTGKEFKDSVNFSRKRYHKIGELTSKPLSREERRLKRKLSIENRFIEKEAKKILKAEKEQGEKLNQEKDNVESSVGCDAEKKSALDAKEPST